MGDDGSRQIVELARVRVLLFLREPEALFWVLAFPVILAVVLGFAFRDQGPEESKVVVLGGAEAKAFAAVLEDGEQLDIEVVADQAEAERRLLQGITDAIVTPGSPPGIRYDPDRSEGTTARLRILRVLELRADPGAAMRAREDTVRKTGSRYIDFLFPGILGMNLMGTGVWSLGFALADLRQKKLLKRMLVTPMRKSSFLLSLGLSRLIFLVIEVGALLAFGPWVLDIPFRGAPEAFVVLTLAGGLAFAALGMLAASRARTLEGVSGILNLVLMPMWLCSGVFFSYERFPDALHPVLRVLPLSALNDGLRAVMLDGGGLGAILPELAIVAVWGIACFFTALKIFRWV